MNPETKRRYLNADILFKLIPTMYGLKDRVAFIVIVERNNKHENNNNIKLQFNGWSSRFKITSTNAESPKYCCTPHSQSSTPSKLHTSPTATPLAPNV